MSNYAETEIRSNSKFLKLEQGTRQIRLLGDALERVIHGFGKEAKDCDGEGCARCADQSEPKQRFRVNIFDHAAQKVMIFEYGAAVGKQLKKIAKELVADQTDITDIDLKISVEGSGMQKKYMVMPWSPAKPLPHGLKLYALTNEEVPF